MALLTDFDVERVGSQQRFVHRDGRPFTAEETGLLVSATDEDMRDAAAELAAAPERLTELLMPYLRTVAGKMTDRPPATSVPRAATATTQRARPGPLRGAAERP